MREREGEMREGIKGFVPLKEGSKGKAGRREREGGEKEGEAQRRRGAILLQSLKGDRRPYALDYDSNRRSVSDLHATQRQLGILYRVPTFCNISESF